MYRDGNYLEGEHEENIYPGEVEAGVDGERVPNQVRLETPPVRDTSHGQLGTPRRINITYLTIHYYYITVLYN